MKIPKYALLAGAALALASEHALGSDPAHRFELRYKRASTETQKRDVTIALIDAGLLYVGSPVSDLKDIFGGDLRDMDLDEKGDRLAIVNFVRPKPPPVPMASPIVTGWFLSVTYRTDGAVVRYCLSNESKETSARLMMQKRRKEGRENEDPGLPLPETTSEGPKDKPRR